MFVGSSPPLPPNGEADADAVVRDGKLLPPAFKLLDCTTGGRCSLDVSEYEVVARLCCPGTGMNVDPIRSAELYTAIGTPEMVVSCPAESVAEPITM